MPVNDFEQLSVMPLDGPYSLDSLFQVKNLKFDLRAQKKEEVIIDLVNLINSNYNLTKRPEKWVDAFMRRERKGSTGLQNGVAVPHIKVEEINRFYLAIGIHHQGMDFRSIDGKPTHVILLLIAPLAEADAHLHFLSMMSRLFACRDFTDKVLQKKSSGEVCTFLQEMLYG